MFLGFVTNKPSKDKNQLFFPLAPPSMSQFFNFWGLLQNISLYNSLGGKYIA